MRARVLVSAVVVVVGLVALGACTKNAEDPAAGPAGEIALPEVDVEVGDVDCAQPADVLYAAGITAPVDERTTTFDAEVEGEEGMANIRVLRGDDVETQFVGTELVAASAPAEGDDEGAIEVTLEGTFVEFDGPEQTGEADGSLTFRCTADTDPGGGFAVVGATQVDYDLVSCAETDESFEVRARSTAVDTESLTLRRVLLRSGWVDTIEADGTVTLDLDEDLNDEAEAAVDVETGLFAARGTRITAEGTGSTIDLTCGIDVSVATED